MSASNPLAPPSRQPWIVRMVGPRPADTLGQQFAEVLRRTLWFLPLELLACSVLASLGVSLGNAGADKIEALMRESVARTLLIAVLLAPVIEEFFFRFLPSRLSDLGLRRKLGSRWALGLPMSFAFALVHNLRSEAGEGSVALLGGLHLDTSVLPVAQFLFGLLLWDLMRRHGWWACMLSHMLHNFVLVGFGLLYLQSQP